MSNKVRHGRAGQKRRPENATHSGCDSLRGLAKGRARHKKRLRKQARQGVSVVVGKWHGTPGATPHTKRQHLRLKWTKGHGGGVQHPWQTELKNDLRSETDYCVDSGND